MKNIPILVLNLPGEFEILPEKVELVLVGEEEALSQVAPEKLVVTLDGRALDGEPAQTIPMRVVSQSVYNLPPGVGVDEGRLPRVFIRTHPKPVLPEPVVVPPVVVPIDGSATGTTPVDGESPMETGSPVDVGGPQPGKSDPSEPIEPSGGVAEPSLDAPHGDE